MIEKPTPPSTRLVTEGANPDGVSKGAYAMVGMGASFIGFVGGLLLNDLAVCVILLPLVIYFAYHI